MLRSDTRELQGFKGIHGDMQGYIGIYDICGHMGVHGDI